MLGRTALLTLVAVMALSGCKETLRDAPPPATKIGDAGGGGSANGAEAAPFTPYAPDSTSSSTGTSMMANGGQGGSFGTMPGTGGVAGLATGPGVGGNGGLPAVGWQQEGSVRHVDLKRPPIGMSRDGKRVLQDDGLLWIDGGDTVGTLVPTIDGPSGLSGEGFTVVGQVRAGKPCPLATRWMGASPELGLEGNATVVSADGKFVAGTTSSACTASAGLVAEAFFWPDKPVRLGALPGDDRSEALALSQNGQVLIGFSSSASTSLGELFTWAPMKGLVPLDASAPRMRRPAFGVVISDDASVIAGTEIDVGGATSGFVWTAAKGLTLIRPPPSRPHMLILGLSADGSIVLGLALLEDVRPPVLDSHSGLPFTRTATGELQLLDLPTFAPPGYSRVLMTPDASLIVGESGSTAAPPVVWDLKRVPRPLFDVGSQFWQHCNPSVRSLSADGKTFAGLCMNPSGGVGWIARLL